MNRTLPDGSSSQGLCPNGSGAMRRVVLGRNIVEGKMSPTPSFNKDPGKTKSKVSRSKDKWSRPSRSKGSVLSFEQYHRKEAGQEQQATCENGTHCIGIV